MPRTTLVSIVNGRKRKETHEVVVVRANDKPLHTTIITVVDGDNVTGLSKNYTQVVVISSMIERIVIIYTTHPDIFVGIGHYIGCV